MAVKRDFLEPGLGELRFSALPDGIGRKVLPIYCEQIIHT